MNSIILLIVAASLLGSSVCEVLGSRMGEQDSTRISRNETKLLVGELQQDAAEVKPAYESCFDVMQTGQSEGVYNISLPRNQRQPFDVFCANDVQHGSGWTVVLRRDDGTVDFNRTWSDYRQGFGNLTGEFFIGLEKLHAMTSLKHGKQELLVRLRAFDENITRHAKYEKFVVGDELSDFTLRELGKYTGDAGDSLRYHRRMKFSTKDVDNDMYRKSCAQYYGGGWWFNDCAKSALTGRYLPDPLGFGLKWFELFDPRNVRHAEMLIRPKQNSSQLPDTHAFT